MTNELAQSVSPESFKGAMRRLANTVTVITSAHDGLLSGMTATAVCSATADPPCLLIVVNRNNRSHRIIGMSGAFTVNLLSDEQAAIADRFASGRDDQYADVQFSIAKSNGCPHIGGVDATVDCRVIERIELKTHTIFIGEAVGTNVNERRPLLYYSGGYVRLQSDIQREADIAYPPGHKDAFVAAL